MNFLSLLPVAKSGSHYTKYQASLATGAIESNFIYDIRSLYQGLSSKY